MQTLNLKTKYIFGKNAILNLPTELKNHKYKKALILYGKGSVKENGILDQLEKVLNTLGLDYVEFNGIEPNPRSTTIDRCIQFCRDNSVDVIFAVGGGSVIDASKVIGGLIHNPQYETSWQYVLDPSKASKPSIDIISIITLAGTSSENNSGSVVTNIETNEKKSVLTPSATPIIAIEDPSYTFTVNAWQTSSGIFDCFSHLLEQYFGKSTFSWTKEYIFANLRVLINYAKTVILRPDHYDARANILWTTSMSLNGLASFNCETDWSVHVLEHAMSGLWDVTHGAGLAFITPTYLQIRSEKEKWFKDKVIELGRAVFKTKTYEATISFIVQFIKSINLPTKWTDFKEIDNFSDDDAKFLIRHSVKFGEKELEDIYTEVIYKLKELK